MNPTLTVPTWRWGGWLLSAGTPKESIWCTKCSLQVKIVSCEKNCLLQESSEFQRWLNLGQRKEEKQPCSLKGEARQQENLFKCCESQDLGRMWSTVHKEIKCGREGIEGNCSAQSSVNSEASLLPTTHAIDYHTQICCPTGEEELSLKEENGPGEKKEADIITTTSTLMRTQVMAVPQLNGSFRSVNKLFKKLFKLASW